jgi:probable HAF family extracellular repeat protein
MSASIRCLFSLGSFCALFAVTAPPGAAADQNYVGSRAGIRAFLYENGKLVDLGALPGDKDSSAEAVNAKGEVVGWSQKGGAFLFRNGKMTSIGGLGNEAGSVTGINDRGDVVGFSDVGPREARDRNFMRAFLYREGKVRDLGAFDGRRSWAHGINDRGQVVGASTVAGDTKIVKLPPIKYAQRGIISDFKWFSSDHMRAFLYTDGKMIDLGALPHGQQSCANAINRSGDAAGWSRDGKGIHHAVLFANCKVIDLGTLGGRESEAYGINNKKQIVGWADTADGWRHAFLYSDGKMTDLARGSSLLGDDSASKASAINDDGTIVGTARGYRGSQGFVYRNGQIETLGAPPQIGSLYRWTSEANAVNAAGQVVGRAGSFSTVR